MNDKLYTYKIDKLLKWILSEEKEGKIFGYYKDMFFKPKENDPFKMERYNKILDNPVGVAAGPQTQLSQNIILSWLFGARFLELKTVQVVDDIEVNKPCIDMYDEGYNCEWSQELNIKDSFEQYLDAWILIHILQHKFNYETGMIFNISVGYDLEGVKSEKVKWFLKSIKNAKEQIADKKDLLKNIYPEIMDINIPSEISNNVTLSTMHGCPPDEIESIAKHLMEEWKFHTAVKMNPTILGKEKLREILNKKLGYKIEVPDEAFEHDITFAQAKKMIQSLSETAKRQNVEFSLKLSNTLETLNSASRSLKTDEKNYMSGRSLHPLTVNAALLLQKEFNGNLDISFSGGADAFNVADLLACNFKPITVCSDLLKPGGYSRLPQYFENLSNAFVKVNTNSIDEFIKFKGNSDDVKIAGMNNLEKYAEEIITSDRYKKLFVKNTNIKTNRELTVFDCVHAPCVETCAISQDVPNYMYYTSENDFLKAKDVILDGNPLPNITGMVCDHLCQTKCTRINIDNSLLIREIKRFISTEEREFIENLNNSKKEIKVAVIGGGPSGLSLAYFLALKGLQVDIFEASKNAGGMAESAIPKFRIDANLLQEDINYIKSLGVNFFFNHKIEKDEFTEINNSYDFIYIGVGAQKGKSLGIKGENLKGVYDQISFLKKIKNEENIDIGKNVAIIGGGNSAIDAARTAKRLVAKKNGEVTVVYRRTKEEMPADKEEIRELLEEKIGVLELSVPKEIIQNRNGLKLICQKAELGEVDSSGRQKPMIIADSDFGLDFDSIITAVGQELEIDFLPNHKLNVNEETKETNLPKIYAGGDAVRGADSLINAIADGKIAANSILKKLGENFTSEKLSEPKIDLKTYQEKLSKRVYGIEPKAIEIEKRNTFELVNLKLDKEEAIEEASRCLYCDEICNICISVCPNIANYSFEIQPFNINYNNIEIANNEFKIINMLDFSINQKYQIINLNDFCNECGNCETFCPTSGAPYKIKDRFSLSKKAFAEETSGYMIEGNSIFYKENNKQRKLSTNNDTYIYEDDLAIIELNNEFLPNKITQKTSGKYNPDMKKIIEMYFYLTNLEKTFIAN